MTNSRYSRYSRIEPNSHFWTDLEQLVQTIQLDNNWHTTKAEREKQMKNTNYIIVDAYKPLTREYVLIGLKNSLKNGYEINKDNHELTVRGRHSFFKIKEILKYIKSKEFSIEHLLEYINNTLEYGYNLTNNIKMERSKIYEHLDIERTYQDLCWSPRRKKNNTPDEEKPPAEWINYIEYHIAKAKENVYLLEDDNVLAELRKVAALAIRCFELHGCPKRIIPEELLNQK